jgi:hypothetical protein
VAKGTGLRSAVERKKNQRRFRYLVAVVGFVLVALELMLALGEVALYQSLICSVYLLFNILIDVSAWTERYWTQKYRRKVSYPEGKLIYGVILIPSWLFFNWLLGLIAPWFSQEIIWWYSFSIIIALILTVGAYRYIARKRESTMAQDVTKEVSTRTQEEKRSAVRRANEILLAIVIPYITVIVILSVLGVLSRKSQSLAVIAFLPVMFFALGLSSMTSNRSPFKEALVIGIFWAMVAVVPFAVAVFMALPVSYQIPYICILLIAYVSFIYWLRLVRARNRQKSLAKLGNQDASRTS